VILLLLAVALAFAAGWLLNEGKCRACRRQKNNAAYHAKRQGSCA